VNYGKSADKAKEVVTGIEAKGGKAVAVQADMSNVADVARLVKDTVKKSAVWTFWLITPAGSYTSLWWR